MLLDYRSQIKLHTSIHTDPYGQVLLRFVQTSSLSAVSLWPVCRSVRPVRRFAMAGGRGSRRIS